VGDEGVGAASATGRRPSHCSFAMRLSCKAGAVRRTCYVGARTVNV